MGKKARNKDKGKKNRSEGRGTGPGRGGFEMASLLPSVVGLKQAKKTAAVMGAASRQYFSPRSRGTDRRRTRELSKN